MVRHGFWPAYGAEEQGVVPADPVFPVARHHLPMLLVIFARREIELVEADVDVMALGHNLQDSKPFRHDLRADAVSGNDRNLQVVTCHRVALIRFDREGPRLRHS